MPTENQIDEILVAWTPPFSYDQNGSQVLDKNGNLALDVRSWGRLVYLGHNRAAAMQDALGVLVVELLNNHLTQ